MIPRSTVLAMLLGLWVMPQPATAQSLVSVADWSTYKQKFLSEGGRIVDDGNGNISHSEGQGYGLLLAYSAGSRADFDRIWSFTRTEMLLRDDGLAVWKWDPASTPHVSDGNNASDGDMLIAYALALAGAAWQRPDFSAAATGIAVALGKTVVVEAQDRMLILPGATGFAGGDRADGPVVNLSYWVFEAFPVLATIAPDTDWSKLSSDGLALVAASTTTAGALPPDWLSLSTRPKPAQGFAKRFGYNGIRIPLYLMRAGIGDKELLQAFREAMSTPDSAVRLASAVAGSADETLSDPGYRIIPALISCVIDGTRLPEDLRKFAPTSYYPSTLDLLALSFAAGRHPECL